MTEASPGPGQGNPEGYKAVHSGGRGIGMPHPRSLDEDYRAWAAGKPDAIAPSHEWTAVDQFLRAYAARHAFPTPDALTPEALAAELPVAAIESSDGCYYAPTVIDKYLHYLHETGRWSRSRKEFNDVHALVRPPDGDMGFHIPQLAGPDAREQWLDVPLVWRAGQLLHWLGEGRDATRTGVLRLQDIGTAASTVGVAALGTPHARRRGWFSAPAVATGSARSPLAVRTMSDVPRLMQLWQALVQADLIDVGATRVRAMPGAPSLLDAHPEKFSEAAFRLTASYMMLLANATPRFPQGYSWGFTVLSFLCASSGDLPPAADSLRRRPANQPPDLSPVGWARGLARAPLVQALDAGLLVAERGRLVVPPVAHAPLAAVIAGAAGLAPQDWHTERRP